MRLLLGVVATVLPRLQVCGRLGLTAARAGSRSALSKPARGRRRSDPSVAKTTSSRVRRRKPHSGGRQQEGQVSGAQESLLPGYLANGVA